jgi:hypothetical protein
MKFKDMTSEEIFFISRRAGKTRIVFSLLREEIKEDTGLEIPDIFKNGGEDEA